MKDNYNVNVYEYEQILLGKEKKYIFSFKGTYEENLIEAGNIWRYAITHLLKWTPAQAETHLTGEIVHKLKLDSVYKKIPIDPTKAFWSDYRFILQYAFPGEVVYSLRGETLTEYFKVCKMGRFVNDKSVENTRLPKMFFMDENGEKRARILLGYCINTYLSDMTCEELYSFFADKKEISKWLKQKNLFVPMQLIYGNPLDYLHETLPYIKKDDFLYYSNKLYAQYIEYKKKLRKEKAEDTDTED